MKMKKFLTMAYYIYFIKIDNFLIKTCKVFKKVLNLIKKRF